MMRLLYSFGIQCYLVLIRIFSIWNPKARLWLKGRKVDVPHLKGRPIWMHCASLGEFEQGRPVIEKLKKQYPGIPVMLTFFSPSGYEVRKNYQGADLVCYLPADTPKKMEKFIALHQPRIVIFVKYEIWHNLIYHLHQKRIPVILIAAKFRPEQVFFKWWGKWFLLSLKYMQQIFVQDDESVKLLDRFGLKCTAAGDTRYDRVAEVAHSWQPLDEIHEYVNGHQVVVAGSTWPEDESLLARFYRENKTKYPLRWIIVPHEVDPQSIQNIIRAFGNVCKYSEGLCNKDSDVLVIDQIGLLSRLYRYATICYVGGGFGAGIHNTLEAAVYGRPVLFGPKYGKFAEAAQLVKIGAARSIKDYSDLRHAFIGWLENEASLATSGAAAYRMVQEGRGATDKIITSIRPLLQV